MVVVVLVVAKATGWSSAILGLYLLGLMLATGKRGDRATKSRVGVRYRYCGLQFDKGINGAFGQNVEGVAEQDIVGGGTKDVDLQVKRDVAEGAGDITSQTE